MREKNYDAIVIGGGHAGAEAAHALAALGQKTLLLSLTLEAIAFMACNPNIGGTAKGHLVKEIDALGGIMGIAADAATIQTRMLNLSSGPAVHSLRAQVDKNLYHRTVKRMLETTENLDILEGEAKELLVEGGRVAGVVTPMGNVLRAGAVILATGVYLNATLITGEYERPNGPAGFMRSAYLTDSLISMGLSLRRFKTGTPPRVLRSSVDISVMEPQYGDSGIPKFSFMTDGEVKNDALCYLTYTNADTHKLILDNLDRSPIYNGHISGTGPRYCPSIETKVVRFADKERHQIFVEPEGADTEEVYIQGLSTSLPFDLQEEMLHTIKGLERAKITRYGYAIEYDCLDPLELLPTLALKKYKGLYSAGQINGSSGYEEAAAQGLVAGINAARFLSGKEEINFRRGESYIGVLIDDLVTKGTDEPYRMMTSRAERRLYLRQDNADLRLTELGREIGLVDDRRYERFLRKKSDMAAAEKALEKRFKPSEIEELFVQSGETPPKIGITGREILKRSKIRITALAKYLQELEGLGKDALLSVETAVKYEGFLEKEEQEIRESARLEEKALSPDNDYLKIEGLRLEARQKLQAVKPLNLAQASRIPGVTPADITVLMLWLRKRER